MAARRTTTLVLLVRHGVTPTTGRVLPGRAPGLHLSEEGRRQAAEVAEVLVGLKPAALYSSPLERARETAAPTEAVTGLPASVDEGLLEGDVGAWTGAEIATVSRTKEWQAVQRSPATFRFPGGESFVEMQARIVAVIERIRNDHAGATAVCFSHADPIKAALAHALGTPLDLFQRIHVNPGSVSALAFRPGEGPSVLTVNWSCHPISGHSAAPGTPPWMS